MVSGVEEKKIYKFANLFPFSSSLHKIFMEKIHLHKCKYEKTDWC